jgi:hypothetical protein
VEWFSLPPRRCFSRLQCCRWSNNNNRGFSAILKVDHEGGLEGVWSIYGTSFLLGAELVFAVTTERRTVSCRAALPDASSKLTVTSLAVAPSAK